MDRKILRIRKIFFVFKLSKDMKPDVKKERERIEKSGGKILRYPPSEHETLKHHKNPKVCHFAKNGTVIDFEQ